MREVSPIAAEDLKLVQDGSLEDRLVKLARVQLRIKVSFSLPFRASVWGG